MRRYLNPYFILLFSFVWVCMIHPGEALAQKKIRLIFDHKVGSEELVLGNSYQTVLGEQITVQKFKYYISNFSITDSKGKSIALPGQYFLVDEADSLSKIITLNIPDIQISSIKFLLGVDSIRNVSGVQSGVLDPLKGMFWTWNSGYIMAKLEGNSEASGIAAHSFMYHIGGFKGQMNVLRNISLSLPDKNVRVSEIHISADINQWFKNKQELKIAETPVCHSPGPLAMKIADNYANMFSINAVR